MSVDVMASYGAFAALIEVPAPTASKPLHSRLCEDCGQPASIVDHAADGSDTWRCGGCAPMGAFIRIAKEIQS